LDLCKELAPGEIPLYVEVCPVSDALPNECFINVTNQIKKKGGDIQHGWNITGLPSIFLEAAFHAVWISPSGSCIDIAPKASDPFDIRQILFLPDKKRIYQGRQVNNVMKPLRDDRIIREYIEVNGKIFDARNRGKLTDQRKVVVTDEIRRLSLQGEELMKKMMQLIGPNSPCPCWSGRKNKKCCKIGYSF